MIQRGIGYSPWPPGTVLMLSFIILHLLSSPVGQKLCWTGDAKLSNSLIPVEVHSQIGEAHREASRYNAEWSVGWEDGHSGSLTGQNEEHDEESEKQSGNLLGGDSPWSPMCFLQVEALSIVYSRLSFQRSVQQISLEGRNIFFENKGQACWLPSIVKIRSSSGDFPVFKKKNLDSLSSGFLSCHATRWVCRCHLGPFILPPWDLRTRGTDANMPPLLLLVVPWAINSFVSDQESHVSSSIHETS